MKSHGRSQTLSGIEWGPWVRVFAVNLEQNYGSSSAGRQLSLLLIDLRKLFFAEKAGRTFRRSEGHSVQGKGREAITLDLYKLISAVTGAELVAAG